jgi:hypothetical protein
MTDELQGVPVKYFTGFNPKVYCFKCEDEETRKAKRASKVVFEENIKFTTSRYASKFGNRFMFVPNVLNQTINIPDQYKPRTNPFSISRGFFDQDKVLFELPKGMQIESIPKPINITSKFGEYSAKLSKNEKGNLIYERSMLLNQGNFSKEEYPKFREFMKSVNKADQSKVILINKT